MWVGLRSDLDIRFGALLSIVTDEHIYSAETRYRVTIRTVEEIDS